MNPVVLHFLLGLWLVVGAAASIVVCALVGFTNGFHIHAQTNRKTGVQTDSTLRWFAIVAGLFMGPPLLLLGLDVAGGLIYGITATLAEFWWVPLMLVVLASTGFLIYRFATKVEVVEVPPPPAPPVPPVVIDGDYWEPQGYGSFGEGGLGTPPKSAR